MHVTAISRGQEHDWFGLLINEVNCVLQKKVNKEEIPLELKALEKKFAFVVDKSKLEENENPMKQVTILRKNREQILVSSIVLDYINLLLEKNLVPENNLELAFDFYGKGILVWVHTQQENEQVEIVCQLIEGSINNKYAEHDIVMATNFIDPSLEIPFPPSYI
ncbi:MAG: hypothetical protein NTW29_08350 [Bacteroidetes bacterium]|nr:hypothetical protein [Bacteroidota bacterium]